MTINIILFSEFCVEINNCKMNLTEKERELMALLVVTGGQKITAKNYWEILVKPKKYVYNARYYTSAVRTLNQSLITYAAQEVMEAGLEPVRFCRINTDAIQCDYYDMLDGKAELLGKEKFLPEYAWASDFYCQSRAEFNRLMTENPLFGN